MVGFSLVRTASVAIALSALLAFGCGSEPEPEIRGPGGEDGSGGTGGTGGSGGAGDGGTGGTGGSGNTGIIGPEGGVVTGEQGVTVTIPAGALASETTITASIVAASGLPARPSGTTAAGPFVALTPHGTQFAMPVEVTLPYTSSSGNNLTVLRIDDENDTTWEVLTGASFGDGTAAISLSHFSILGVAAPDAGGSGGTGGSACEGFDNCIGPDGGWIWEPLQVYIPEGALAAETPIGVAVIDGVGLPAFPEGLQPAGPFVALTPHGTQFAIAVEVSLPHDDCSSGNNLTVLRLDDENDTTWEVAFTIPFSSGGNVETVEVDRFSILTVAVDTCLYFGVGHPWNDSCSACTSNEDCESHEFCAKDGCDGPGVCRQGTCRRGNSGVCGCDGLTYVSPQEAASQGRTNVASDGRCECNDDNDCVGEFETCDPFYIWANFYGVPSCDVSLGCTFLSFGYCDPDPPDPQSPIACCPDRPVCGCDGVTYDCPWATGSVGIAAYSACE